jgi:hypothetical protein
MMKCGHAANAENGKGEPSCVICVGIHPGAEVVDDAPPSLAGRIAKCNYSHGRDGKPCKKPAPSHSGLPFFTGKPNEAFDEYYCGCWGWD